MTSIYNDTLLWMILNIDMLDKIDDTNELRRTHLRLLNLRRIIYLINRSQFIHDSNYNINLDDNNDNNVTEICLLSEQMTRCLEHTRRSIRNKKRLNYANKNNILDDVIYWGFLGCLWRERIVSQTSNCDHSYIFSLKNAAIYTKYYQINQDSMTAYGRKDIWSSMELGDVLFPDQIIFDDNMQGSMKIINSNRLFTERLIAFIVDDSNIKLFDNICWDNMAITGSCIPALIVEDDNKQLLYRDQYIESDIDMCCNHSTFEEYIKHVKNVIDTLKDNLKCDQIYVNRKCCTRIYCPRDEYYPSDVDNIDSCKNKTSMYHERRRLLFLSYLQEKSKCKMINDIDLPIHNSMDDWEWISKCTVDDRKSFPVNWRHYKINCNQNQIIICETVKFKIFCEKLLKPIEIYLSSGSKIQSVSRHHFGCVRGYYSDNKLFLSASAICSYYSRIIRIPWSYNNLTLRHILVIIKYIKRGFQLSMAEINREKLIQSMIDHIGIEQYDLLIQDRYDSIHSIHSMLNTSVEKYLVHVDNMDMIQ